MKKTMTFHRKKIWMVFLVCALMLLGLVERLVYLMGVRSDYYYQKAEELHERERVIKAARGQILDAKGRILADNKTVCTISVIHSQIKEPQKVIEVLSKELEIDTDTVRKKVEKISSIERIKTNVEKSVGDVIRGYELDGVKVDEDYKRYYPYGSLASKVLGFTGGDNQGIIGLEVKYEEILKGQAGKILTTTDARGVEIDQIGESREDPVAGENLKISLDVDLQQYAGLEAGVVSVNDRFFCPGYKLVDDRRIHCARRTGHGSQSFVEGAQNSCNPVFIEVGLRLGVENYYHYFKEFGLLKKTGVDLPGEAGTIMHKMENMGNVELATVAFGQSFQITPIQLATTVSSLINGGRRITPHFGVSVLSSDGTSGRKLEYPVETGIISEKTSETVRGILEKVVSEGSGRNARIEGCTVGGKTATSQTLPRSANRYISSFLGFMPAEDPQILGLCIIHDPQGVYYGGTIAAPVIKNIFEAVLERV